MADADFTAREKIRKDVSSNYFVEAGAGSGKTSVLVDRMVSMVESGIDISKICAITFTKAAAGEFYARFQRKLSEPADLETKEVLRKEALRNIDLCFMGTIDSFCNMALSEHPMEAGIPSNATVIDSGELAALLKEEYSAILKGEVGSGLRDKAIRCMDYCWNLQDVFLSAMPELLEIRNAHLNYDVPKSGKPESVFSDEKKKLLDILKNLKEHPELVSTEGKEPQKAWENLLNGWDTISGTWDRDLNSVIKCLGSLKTLRIIPQYDPEKGSLGPDFKGFFSEHYTKGKLTWYEIEDAGRSLYINSLRSFQFSVLMDFLADAVPVVAQNLKKQGKLTFTDYLIYFRDLLKSDTEKGGKLIKHISERHSYFLIDEFQDTNPLQAEIIFFLTAKKPEKNWTNCIPRPGSIFIVGDPKQSIYRFQNADVTSFNKVKNLFCGSVGEVLKLTRNFRSCDEICSWFNKTFEALLPDDTDVQSKFEKIPTGEKMPYLGTFKGAYCYQTAYEKKVENRKDPEQVAGIIQGIVHNPKFLIQDRDKEYGKKGCQPRQTDYRDFMVIVPNKNHLAGYTDMFVRNRIPFKVEGKILFKECPALVGLSSIFSAVADPYDKEWMFRAGKFSCCDIHENEIIKYAVRAKTMSAVAVLTMLMDEVKIFLHAGTKNAEYLYYAIELLRSEETKGDVSSLKDAAAFLNGLIEDPKAQERCIQLVRDENRVHIANLHKVKGLEKPIVILADPDQTTHGASLRVDYSNAAPESWIFKLDDGNKGTFETFDYEDEKKKEEDVLDAERVRLLYVAATRAGNVLIAADSVTKQGRYASNPWGPLLDFIPHTFDLECKKETIKDPELQDAAQLYSEAEESCVLKERASEKSSYELKRPSLEKLNRITETEEEYHEEDSKGKRQKGNAAVVGTLVHRLMEVLVTSKNTVSLQDAVKDILSEYDAEPAVYEAMLLKVGETVRNGGYKQKSGAPEDILSELLGADEVYCELPFCFRDGTEIWNGVMDVVYSKGGRWHIIDYKTNEAAAGLEEKYEYQLEAYKKALRISEGLEADAKIYHIGI